MPLTERQREVLEILGSSEAPLSERDIFEIGRKRGLWPRQTNLGVQLWALFGRDFAAHTGRRGSRKWGIAPAGREELDAVPSLPNAHSGQ